MPAGTGVPVTAAAAKDPAAIPLPRVANAPNQVQLSTSATQALPPPPDRNVTGQPQTIAAQAEQPDGKARREFADQKPASQGRSAAPVAASKAASHSVAVKQQKPAGHARSTNTAAVVGHTAPAQALAAPPLSLDAAKQPQQPITSAVSPEQQPADPSAAATAQADTPEHSFDGRQSFISLDFDDAPAGGAASVDQPSPASRKAKHVVPEASIDTAKAASAQLPAASEAAGNAPQADETMHAKRSSQQEPQQQPAVNTAAVMEVDKRDIKPDLFTASRPSSAVSQGAGTLKFDADQKQLPAAKSKVAPKGNIQIVLATKHKQVCVGHLVWALLKRCSCTVLPGQEQSLCSCALCLSD